MNTLRAGLRKFADFDSEDVCTTKSAFKFANLANSSGTLIMGFVEPLQGTADKSPMQRFLDHHGGPGVQHIAIASQDIFATLRRMRSSGAAAPGLGFMPRPSKAYYECAPALPAPCNMPIAARTLPQVIV